jgi:hypothetical protein
MEDEVAHEDIDAAVSSSPEEVEEGEASLSFVAVEAEFLLQDRSFKCDDISFSCRCI